MNQIVLAFTPSDSVKDYQFRWDKDGKPCYEQRVQFYCMAHKEHSAGGFADCSPRSIGKEPYYNLIIKRKAKPPRIYVDHHPQKGEWEDWKTIDDIKQSELYVKG